MQCGTIVIMSNNNLPHWDLTPIYAGVDKPDFLSDLESVVTLSKKLMSDIEAHKPLYDIITSLNEIITIQWTLNSYANAILTTDTSNGLYIKAVGSVEESGLKFQEAEDLFVSKIKEYENEFSDPRLKDYQYILNEYLEESKHQMSLAEEALASDLARSGVGAFERLYDSVSSSICDNDKTVIQLRNDATNPDRAIRKASYEREKKVWKEHEVAFAASLNSIKGTVLTLEKRRGWNDPLEHSAFQARVSVKALDALINTLEKNRAMFAKYFAIKAKLLGVDKLAWYDLFAPVGSLTKEYSFEEAKEIIIKCYSAFDPRMGEFAKKAFKENWIDAEPRKGKVGGAYDTSMLKVKQSRILSNFDGSYDSVSTLAHELGHAYHDSVVMDLPALLSDYPMTVAETASIFAETIVFDAILKDASEEEAITLIESYVGSCAQVCVDILSRFYFERSVFEKRKDGELTPDEFTSLMIQAQENSYGDAVCDKHERMWEAKGHYYSSSFSFYNYPYAFGQLFALGLYASKDKTKNFNEKYREILKLTGSTSANNVALAAGCDIENEEFWQEGMNYISTLIERLGNYCK